MTRKQKMVALGAGALMALVLLALVLILLVHGCSPQAPSHTAQTPGPEETETTAAPTTLPPETTVPPTTLPPETTVPPTAAPEPVFREVSESVTAKIETNLRDAPDQESSTVLHTLQNGQWVTRTGISDGGWSRLEWNGTICYAISNYLTVDPNYVAPSFEEEDDGINTVFTACNDRVTAKELVNLRTIPSVTRADSVVIAQLPKGQWITRTGINTDVGWSRVEYNGQTLYCITSYLLVEDTQTEPEG